MNDLELERLLQSARVPQRPEDYWRQFPGRVMAKIHWCQVNAGTDRSADLRVRPALSEARPPTIAFAFLYRLRLPALGLAVAVVCILVGFALGFRNGRRLPAEDQQLAEARKYFHEIAGLFPNQVQAIVFDQNGARLVLAEQPDVPASPPLYVKFCGPGGCKSFVTFSGQQIRVNGDVFEVLVDRRGDVLLVGRESAWSSASAETKAGRYRIEARNLGTAS
jgi:hypothetical protein